MRFILLHGHIFKNAGTTFDWSLQRSFGKGFLDHRQEDLMRSEGARHLAELVQNQPQLRAISSHHMPSNLPDISGVRFVPVYLLRHPLERIRSAYDFERAQKVDTPGSRAAKNKDFRGYVEWRMHGNVSRTIRNYQTLYLAGWHGRANNGAIAIKYFSDAIDTLRSVPEVGLVERYDESMVMLEESLRDRFPDVDLSYVPQNVSRSSRRELEAGELVAQTLQQLGPLQKQVIDENSYDLALYQVVNSRLDAQTGRIDDFHDKLRDFHRRCSKLRKRG
jgi:hypothetical protein